MKYPYSVKFMDDKDFESLLESCGCGGEDMESDGLEMTMANVAKIHEYSGMILSMLSGREDIEDWMEDKLAKASQSIADVKHYLEFKSSAYGGSLAGVGGHGMDVTSGQKMSVAGNPSGRLEGDRLTVMTKDPVMTPPSSLQGTTPGVAAGMADDMAGMDYGDDDAPIEPTGGAGVAVVAVDAEMGGEEPYEEEGYEEEGYEEEFEDESMEPSEDLVDPEEEYEEDEEEIEDSLMEIFKR